MTSSYSSELNESNSSALSLKAFSVVRLFALAIMALLLFGWSLRNDYWITAERGTGYALGIIGGAMMLLLLIYPLRKRFYRSRLLIFSTKNWFRLHMLLGIFGPLLILYHCNFSLGSTNSNVALASMLLMVASGLVGRFIYGKIHHGLYGQRIQLQELQENRLFTKTQLDNDQHSQTILVDATVVNKLTEFEQAVACHKTLPGHLLRVATLGLTTRASNRSIFALLKKNQKLDQRYLKLPAAEKKKQLSTVRKHLRNYLSTVRKIAELSLYERLFSLWHMLHLPIFFMLIITGFVHVYAVHRY